MQLLYMFRVSQHPSSYLHTFASVGFLFTLNYDARNHELKMYSLCVVVF